MADDTKTPVSKEEKEPRKTDSTELEEELEDVSGGLVGNYNCGCG
jgi:hypothetical protein